MGVSYFLLFKEIDTFIQQGWIKLIKNAKYIYNITNNLYFN